MSNGRNLRPHGYPPRLDGAQQAERERRKNNPRPWVDDADPHKALAEVEGAYDCCPHAAEDHMEDHGCTKCRCGHRADCSCLACKRVREAAKDVEIAALKAEREALRVEVERLTNEGDRLRRALEDDAHELGRLRKLLAYLVSDEMRVRIACILAKQPNHVEQEASAVVALIRDVQADQEYLSDKDVAAQSQVADLRVRLAELVAACDEHRLTQAEYSLALTTFRETWRGQLVGLLSDRDRACYDTMKHRVEEFAEADKQANRREAAAWEAVRAALKGEDLSPRKEGT